MIGGVIYDHDGTLVDSLRVVVAATNEVLRSRSLPERPADEIVAAMVMPTTPRMGHHARIADPAGQRELAREFYEAAHRLDPSYANAYPGVVELVAAVAARGLPQAMVSNNQGGLIRKLMAALELDAHFACILGEDDVPAPKPDPRGIVQAAGALALPVGRCVYVGDGRTDVATAHGAGMRIIGVTWGIHPRGEMLDMGFDALVDTPAALLALIDSL